MFTSVSSPVLKASVAKPIGSVHRSGLITKVAAPTANSPTIVVTLT